MYNLKAMYLGYGNPGTCDYTCVHWAIHNVLFDGKQHTYIIGVSDIYEKFDFWTLFWEFHKCLKKSIYQHFFTNVDMESECAYISYYSSAWALFRYSAYLYP